MGPREMNSKMVVVVVGPSLIKGTNGAKFAVFFSQIFAEFCGLLFAFPGNYSISAPVRFGLVVLWVWWNSSCVSGFRFGRLLWGKCVRCILVPYLKGPKIEKIQDRLRD